MWLRLPKPGAIADACGRAVRRSLSTVAAVVAVAAIGGGAWAGYRWLTTSPRFAITAITIHGTHNVDPDDLRAALPIRAGDNVFAGLDEVVRVVRKNPWIAAAEVHRILPHTIAIEVREHTAAAVVDLGERYLTDESGHPFKRAAFETQEGDGLPLITGIGRASYLANPDAAAVTVKNAIAAADAWRIRPLARSDSPAARADGDLRSRSERTERQGGTADRPAVGEVHVDPHGAVTLYTLDQAIAIQLGAPGPLDARMRTFDAAWAGLSDVERARARAIHVGARPDHVTVAFAKD
jgi:hypothetical protein